MTKRTHTMVGAAAIALATVAALMALSVVVAPKPSVAAADKRVMFDTLKVFTVGPSEDNPIMVTVSGTLTGDDIANNGIMVTCAKAGSPVYYPGHCIVVRAEQISRDMPLIGRLEPRDYPIVRWNNMQIVAMDDPSPAIYVPCRIDIIDIRLRDQTVTWYDQPNPKAEIADCTNVDMTKRYRWTIEGWKR